MAAKIPQDVTREDRLIGPLTLKQFLYLLFGGAIIFTAYQYYINFYLYFIEFASISLIVASLTVALAFAQINGRPFGIFLINLWGYLFSPKMLVWEKQESMPIKVHQNPTTNASDDKNKGAKKGANASQLELLAQVLDTGGKMNREIVQDEPRIGQLGQNLAQVEEPEVEDVLLETDE